MNIFVRPCLVALLSGFILLSFAQASDGTRDATSIDDLFATPSSAEPTSLGADPIINPQPQATAMPEPRSLDELFGEPAKPGTPEVPPLTASAGLSEALLPVISKQTVGDNAGMRVGGFFQNALAYTYPKPSHWSKFRNTLDASMTGSGAGGIQWKLGGRLSYDPIYDLTDHYNSEVRQDQRIEASIREAHLDIPAGDWEFRLGRQHIVWGEMVGLFFADVVSAKDLRELALPDFEMIRIPQWAARAEYFQGDFHGEAVWIPYMTYDDIGKPGAEFYPFTPPQIAGALSVISKEKHPVGLQHSAYGARLSYLKSGWDVSGLIFSGNDTTPAFSRLTPLAPPTIIYQPIHKRITKLGVTIGKDLGAMVLKAEAVYTFDKLVNVIRPTDPDGLVEQDVLDYIVGLEWSLPEETRFNIQFYERRYPSHDPDSVQEKTDGGFTVLLSTLAFHPKVEPKILLLRSLNDNDWLTQFKVTWKVDDHWQAVFGADIFGGQGVLGLFDDKDRIYTEIRYNF